MKKFAIIVAGGNGSRMQSDIPKQFLILHNEPVLMHTIRAFFNYHQGVQIIIVLPDDQIAEWHRLTKEHSFTIPHQIVKGGPSRFDSVNYGLQTINEQGLVAIHDGVRPFVSSHLIGQCFLMAESFGSGVAAVAARDSIRIINGEKNSSLDRAKIQLIQTPQTFRVDEIKAAFAAFGSEKATDDASIAEQYGIPIKLVESNYQNIKITTPEDIAIAQALYNDIVKL